MVIVVVGVERRVARLAVVEGVAREARRRDGLPQLGQELRQPDRRPSSRPRDPRSPSRRHDAHTRGGQRVVRRRREIPTKACQHEASRRRVRRTERGAGPPASLEADEGGLRELEAQLERMSEPSASQIRATDAVRDSAPVRAPARPIARWRRDRATAVRRWRFVAATDRAWRRAPGRRGGQGAQVWPGGGRPERRDRRSGASGVSGRRGSRRKAEQHARDRAAAREAGLLQRPARQRGQRRRRGHRGERAAARGRASSGARPPARSRRGGWGSGPAGRGRARWCRGAGGHHHAPNRPAPTPALQRDDQRDEDQLAVHRERLRTSTRATLSPDSSISLRRLRRRVDDRRRASAGRMLRRQEDPRARAAASHPDVGDLARATRAR